MGLFADTFLEKPVIGMLHLYGVSREEKLERALADLTVFERCGVHGAIVENYDHRTTSIMDAAIIAREILAARVYSGALGVNILSHFFRHSFEIAKLGGLPFVQLDAVAGNYPRHGWFEDEWVEGHKGIEKELARNYDVVRSETRAAVLGGVWPKYYGKSTNELSVDLANGMLRADAIVVTGEGTGIATPLEKIVSFRAGLDALSPDERVPLVLGAGSSLATLNQELPLIDGVIVGSTFKQGKTRGDVSGPVEYNLVAPYMDRWRALSARE